MTPSKVFVSIIDKVLVASKEPLPVKRDYFKEHCYRQEWHVYYAEDNLFKTAFEGTQETCADFIETKEKEHTATLNAYRESMVVVANPKDIPGIDRWFPSDLEEGEFYPIECKWEIKTEYRHYVEEWIALEATDNIRFPEVKYRTTVILKPMRAEQKPEQPKKKMSLAELTEDMLETMNNDPNKPQRTETSRSALYDDGVTPRAEETWNCSSCGKSLIKKENCSSPVNLPLCAKCFNEQKSYVTETGALISAHDYAFLSDSRKSQCKPLRAEEAKAVNYFHIQFIVKCPFEACKYEGLDSEFNLTFKGPDTIRVCPKCGNGHVIATTTTSSGTPLTGGTFELREVEELPAVKESVDKLVMMSRMSRIADASSKCFEWCDGEITGFDMKKFEQKVLGILGVESQKAEPVRDKDQHLFSHPFKLDDEDLDVYSGKEFAFSVGISKTIKDKDQREFCEWIVKKLNGGEPVEGQESQDDLWDALMTDWHDVSMNMPESHILPHLKSKFQLTRKGR